MESLLRHPWPGNVRELDHTVERAVLMAQVEEITEADLGLRAAGDESAPLDAMNLEETERALIRKALGQCEGNVSEAAKVLGLSRSALYRRLEKHNL